MMPAVHAQFAVAVDLLDLGVRLEEDNVPVRPARGIEVRQHFG